MPVYAFCVRTTLCYPTATRSIDSIHSNMYTMNRPVALALLQVLWTSCVHGYAVAPAHPTITAAPERNLLLQGRQGSSVTCSEWSISGGQYRVLCLRCRRRICTDENSRKYSMSRSLDVSCPGHHAWICRLLLCIRERIHFQDYML